MRKSVFFLAIALGLLAFVTKTEAKAEANAEARFDCGDCWPHTPDCTGYCALCPGIGL